MIKKNLLIFSLLVFLLFPVFLKKGVCAKIVPLPDLKQAETILVDDNQLYITEKASVYIYSLKNLKLKKTFGRKGEGPAEFKITVYRGLFLLLRKNYLVVDSYGRLSFFTKDGQFKAEFKTMPTVGKYVSLGVKLVGLGFKQYDKLNYFTFTIFDYKANDKKEIYRYKHPYQPRRHYNPLETTRLPSYVTYDNKLYLRGEKNTILVFDDTGKTLAPIRFPYHEVKLTGKHKNYYITWYKTDPKFKPIYERDKRWIQFPDYFPVIRDFIIADEKIYVLTYEMKDGKNRLLELNPNGQLLQEAFIPLEEENAFRLFPYTVKGGMLYQVLENEEEEIWELHIHPVSPSLVNQ
jgi:hypothetical protein